MKNGRSSINHKSIDGVNQLTINEWIHNLHRKSGEHLRRRIESTSLKFTASAGSPASSPERWGACPPRTPRCRGSLSGSWRRGQTPGRAAWACSRGERRGGGSAGATPARSGPPWAPPRSGPLSGSSSRTQSPEVWPSQLTPPAKTEIR